MKKKQLIIISLIVVVLILVVSLFYPPAEESDSTGTIGKVDKYRSNETGQEKIVLRNEFLQDTTALKAVITSLGMYENYLTDLAKDFKEWETSLRKTEVENQKLEAQLEKLNSLAVFMKNNLSTVGNTKELLNKFYTKDTVDMSIDIQNNLIQFDTFVSNLDDKSKVVDSLFVNLTGMLDKDKLAKLTLTKEQTESLKEIREKMLCGIFIEAVTMGNEERLNLALKSNVLNFTILNRELNNKLEGIIIFAKNNIGMSNKDQLNVFMNKDNLGIFAKENGLQNKENLGLVDAAVAAKVNNKELGGLVNNKTLGVFMSGGSYLFGKDNMGSNQLGGTSVFAKDGLQAFTNYARTLNLFVFNRDKLGVMNKENLKAF